MLIHKISDIIVFNALKSIKYGYLEITKIDGEVLRFSKDGTAFGLVGVSSTKMHIGTGNANFRFRDDLTAIIPANANGSNSDNDLDLGYSTVRWRRLYLSDGVFIGGTGTANKLDDYEEGTFTPAFDGGVNGTGYTHQVGAYTKIGNHCYFQIQITGNGNSANTSQVRISGLPFASANSSPYGGATVNYNANFKGDGNVTFHKGANDTLLYFYENDGSSFTGNEATNINASLLLHGFYRTA